MIDETATTATVWINGGALATLITGLVLAAKGLPALGSKILEQHNRMLDTFSKNADAERAACNHQFEQVIVEMRRSSDQLTRDMHDLASRNLKAIEDVEDKVG